MNPADIRKLLGGYAAGILTEEERRALFEAALTDQDLFNELAREQALKEVLDDPGARRQLLTALEEKPGFVDRLRAWMGRPVAWVAAGSLAVGAMLVVVLVRQPKPAAPEKVLVAQRESAREPEVESDRAPSMVSEDRRQTASVPSPSVAPRTVSQTAVDREKAARAPIAIPAAPPASRGLMAPPAAQSSAGEVSQQPGRGRADQQMAVIVEPSQAAAASATGGTRGAFTETEPKVEAAVQDRRMPAPPPPPAIRAAPPPPPAAKSAAMAVEVTAAQPQLKSESASNAISLDAMKADSPRNALNVSPAGVGETGSMARAYRALPPTVPFKLLRAAGRREYAEVPQGTLIGPADRVRIVFSPAARGRLVARAEGRPRPLLDRDVREGSTVNLDVPSGVRELQVTFTPRAEPARAVQGVSPAQPAPFTFSIPIPLEPAR